MRATPGVAAATLNSPPVPWEGLDTAVQIAGEPVAEDQRAHFSRVGDRFFELVGIDLLQGRGVSRAGSGSREEWSRLSTGRSQDAILRENRCRHPVRDRRPDEQREDALSVPQPWFEIVGVSADMVVTSFHSLVPVTATEPAIYIPFTVDVQEYAQVVLRTTGKPSDIKNSLRRASAALDKELPLNILSLEDQQDLFWFDFPRFVTTTLVLFASLGLVLVSVGVYSVLAYAVSRRTQEIGIRMALGAQATDVQRMVMMSGVRWLALGIGIGAPTSIALAKILQNRIWGIKSTDPLTFVAVSLLLLAMALLACYIPARRATKVDPMEALRYE